MNKLIVIAIFCCLTTVANAEIVSDKKNNEVNDLDLNVLLETAPEGAQVKLLNDKKKLKTQLELLYMRKILADMARAEGLDKDVLNEARLQAIVDNALFLLKLEDLKKSNTKDYTKYAQQIYTVNKEDYHVEERIDAAHILVSVPKLSKKEALLKADELRLQLMAGADFAELALKESDDKSVKRNKGELGTFKRGQMVKAFSDVAFAMQLGELSQPVKTQYGYHLIKLNKKVPAGVRPFSEVKGGIINKLKVKDWGLAKAEFYQKIKEDNEMIIDDAALDAFVTKKLEEFDNQ
ncbi:MAG: hypothetical protein GQ582_00780 [Methyloprofundus sp.]|nr:hypothetical protein [Methyloprofundus sp.]